MLQTGVLLLLPPTPPMTMIYLDLCPAKVVAGKPTSTFQCANKGKSWTIPRVLCDCLRAQLNLEMGWQECSAFLGCLISTFVPNQKLLIYSLAENTLGL